jgi:hypothetical protein
MKLYHRTVSGLIQAQIWTILRMEPLELIKVLC